ncbi:hypothetical protein VTN02DRAFT_368 [Thermoascus thermophilus]
MPISVSPAPAMEPGSESWRESKHGHPQALSTLSCPNALVAVVPQTNSQDPRPADLSNPISEESDGTASESVEPVTPTSDSFPPPLSNCQQGPVTSSAKAPECAPSTRNPLIINTAATPESTPPRAAAAANEPSAAPARPSPLRSASHSIKALFRRSISNAHEDAKADLKVNLSPKEALHSSNGGLLSSKRRTSLSAPYRSSPASSKSNSPKSPSSPSSTLNTDVNGLLGTSAPPERPGKHSISSAALTVKGKIKFGATPRPHYAGPRLRSPSLGDLKNQPDRPGFSIPAAAGVGLKARRMSTSLPDDFTVDTCELHDEFVRTSRVPGRRGKEIGKGATATVTVMYRKGYSKDVQYAVKEFRKRSQKEDPEEYEKKVKSEFSIANSLHHPNIVRTVRLCTHSGRWNHVMEYCSHGELYELIQRNYLKFDDKMCLFKQLLRGVAYLHDNGIAHRDIKLENLLLSNEGHLKITDFGVSEVFSGIHPGLRSAGGQCGKEMGEVRKCAPGICGSLPYIAPEVLSKKGDYDPRPLDVWSCAIVCLAMVFRVLPWESADRKDKNYAKFIDGWDEFMITNLDGVIAGSQYPSCGKIFSLIPKEPLRRLILQMLHPDPKSRISIHDALNDRWVKTIECCCPEPQEVSKAPTSIDAADKDSCKLANRLVVQKTHNHIPPEKK